MFEEYGQGSAAQDPAGSHHTIDPQVNVLRVDKLSGGKRVPIGIWSTFANHGTVVKPTFAYYNGDHHAAAARLAEAAIRRAGKVPSSQEVVNAYGNSDEGDMTAGLRFSGPADAYDVGRREAKAFIARLAPSGAEPDFHTRSRLALDDRVLLRQRDGGGTGGRPRGGGDAVPDRLGGEPRAAL